MKRLKTLLLVSLLLIMPIGFASGVVSADTSLDRLCGGYDLNDENSQAPEICWENAVTTNESTGDNRLFTFLGEVVSILLYALGIVTVIAVIIGGVMYTTSTGDPQKTTRARNTIIYALIGLVVAVVSQLIILFVLDRI